MTRSLTTSLLTAFVAVLLTAVAHAAPVEDAYLRIKSAADRADIDGLEQVVRELDAQRVKDGATLLAASVADYRIATVAQRDRKHDAARIDAAIERAESRLTTLTDRDASSPDAPSPRLRAEGLALLASVWGLHIRMHPVQGPFLGLKASRALAQAHAMAPNDPRVRLAQGLHALHVPPVFGGDLQQALVTFEQVATLIPVEQASAVNWGLDDAWLWRGFTLRALKRPADARAAFQQALAIAPDNEWARALVESGEPRTGRLLAN
jgi:tetratricopeptide (TPR) repeat protein